VGYAVGQEHERAGTGLVGLFAHVEGELALEHIEALVVGVVQMARGLAALGSYHLHQPEAPIGLLGVD